MERRLKLTGIVLATVLTAGLAAAQTPTTGPILSLTATTDNVAGAPESIRIDLFRWSTDAERDQLLSAWNLTAAPATGGRGGRGAGGRVRNFPAPLPSELLIRLPIPLPSMLTERRTAAGAGRAGAAGEGDVAGAAAGRRQRFPHPLRRRKVR